MLYDPHILSKVDFLYADYRNINLNIIFDPHLKKTDFKLMIKINYCIFSLDYLHI